MAPGGRALPGRPALVRGRSPSGRGNAQRVACGRWLERAGRPRLSGTPGPDKTPRDAGTGYGGFARDAEPNHVAPRRDAGPGCVGRGQEHRSGELGRPARYELPVGPRHLVADEREHLQPVKRGEFGRGEQGEDPGRGHVAGSARSARGAGGGVLEHPVPDRRGRDARPGAHHPGAVRAGPAPADQDLRRDGEFQILPGPVQQSPYLGGRQAEYQAQVHFVPAGQLEGLNLRRVQARDRVLGHQPAVGVILLRPGDRVVGVPGGNCLAPAALAAGQAVKPRAEPFIAGQASGLRGGDNQDVAHRGLCVFAIPEQTPAIAEEAVPVCVDKLPERIR